MLRREVSYALMAAGVVVLLAGSCVWCVATLNLLSAQMGCQNAAYCTRDENGAINEAQRYAAIGLLGIALGGFAALSGYFLKPVPDPREMVRAEYERPETPIYCTVCGHPLSWIRESGQWYCEKCGQFRFQVAKPQVHHDV
jgi:ribosomal protein L37AE/L43A